MLVSREFLRQVTAQVCVGQVVHHVFLPLPLSRLDLFFWPSSFVRSPRLAHAQRCQKAAPLRLMAHCMVGIAFWAMIAHLFAAARGVFWSDPEANFVSEQIGPALACPYAFWGEVFRERGERR